MNIRAHASQIKRRVKTLTYGNFWLRYSTLAVYRSVCAAAISLTGKTWLGTEAQTTSIEDSVAHTKWVFGAFAAAARSSEFHGQAAEVGPGEGCALALMLLAHGCSHVDLADRFGAISDSSRQEDINRAIVSNYQRLAAMQRGGGFKENTFPIRRYTGANASAENFFCTHRGYDLIVSAAVLEHASNPLLAVSRMANALNPGGLMIHGIDFRDHGQFSESFHDLKFLELPESLYAPLKWQGGPNRVRMSAYVRCLSDIGLANSFLPCSLVGTKELFPPTPLSEIPEELIARARQIVASERKNLAAKLFSELDDTDLMISGGILVAHKP